jgi:hypothetical protein
VIGAAVVAVIGAALVWQGGWLRSGSSDGASRTTAAAPAASPSSAPAAEKSAPPASVVDANAARAQAESEAQRARSDAEAIKRQAEAELARARSSAEAGKAARAKAEADAAAARVRAQAEADAARIRADAEASAARTRSDAEATARAAAAQAPKSAPVQQDSTAKAQAAPVAPATLAPDKSVPASAGGVGRFDGTWNVTVDCPKHTDGALGYTLRFVAQVKDGFLRGDRGTAGTTGWLRLEGAIQPDGNATLEAKTITGDPKYNVGNLRQGVVVNYTVVSRFDDSRGTGRRMQHRECAVTFVKQ